MIQWIQLTILTILFISNTQAEIMQQKDPGEFITKTIEYNAQQIEFINATDYHILYKNGTMHTWYGDVFQNIKKMDCVYKSFCTLWTDVGPNKPFFHVHYHGCASSRQEKWVIPSPKKPVLDFTFGGGKIIYLHEDHTTSELCISGDTYCNQCLPFKSLRNVQKIAHPPSSGGYMALYFNGTLSLEDGAQYDDNHITSNFKIAEPGSILDMNYVDARITIYDGASWMITDIYKKVIIVKVSKNATKSGEIVPYFCVPTNVCQDLVSNPISEITVPNVDVKFIYKYANYRGMMLDTKGNIHTTDGEVKIKTNIWKLSSAVSIGDYSAVTLSNKAVDLRGEKQSEIYSDLSNVKQIIRNIAVTWDNKLIFADKFITAMEENITDFIEAEGLYEESKIPAWYMVSKSGTVSMNKGVRHKNVPSSAPSSTIPSLVLLFVFIFYRYY